MRNFFKFKFVLMIDLCILLTTDVTGSFSLNPNARPYFPQENDCNNSIVKAFHKGDPIFALPETLLMLEEATSQEVEKYNREAQEKLFWAAVHNSYHRAAFKLGEALFSNLFPETARPFPILSTLSKADKATALSNFYLFLAGVQSDQFLLADRVCFTRHAANFIPQ
jgi:hypothetical protein